MADNYLERQYDAYLAKKAAKEKAKKLAWQKQLRAYKARLAAEKAASEASADTTKEENIE
ncbi:MAG: hypothetical protein ACI308_02505 [Muribaculaceae bacterium]